MIWLGHERNLKIEISETPSTAPLANTSFFLPSDSLSGASRIILPLEARLNESSPPGCTVTRSWIECALLLQDFKTLPVRNLIELGPQLRLCLG
jgi:hypothetical protein